MAQCCTTRLSVLLWIIMLLFGCFVIFVAVGVVNSAPQRRPSERVDQSKEVQLVSVVRHIILCSGHFAPFTTTNSII